MSGTPESLLSFASSLADEDGFCPISGYNVLTKKFEGKEKPNESVIAALRDRPVGRSKPNQCVRTGNKWYGFSSDYYVNE